MKKFIFLLFAWSIILSTSAGVKIKGELSNAKDNQTIYLYKNFVGQLSLLDSAKVKADKFDFKFSSLQHGQYIIGLNSTQSAPIILGTENVSVTADAGAFQKTFTCTESKENELFDQYIKMMMDFESKTNEINLKARKITAADPERNEKIGELQEEFNSIKKERDDQLEKFRNEYPQSYSGICANYILTIEKQGQEDFFNSFSDLTLQHGNVLVQSFNVYFTNFLAGKSQNEIKTTLQNLPSQVEKGTAKQEAVYLGLIEWLKAMDAKFASSVANGYYQDFPQSPYIASLKSMLPALPPDVGDMAPDIVMNNLDGEEMKLSALKGKVVLIDFWASWCGPCRRENPNVVRTYNEYKDKGFTVFSVSLDQQLGKWKGAIEKDQLVWENHVSDLKGWGSAGAKLYGVGSIPSTFLVDENGIIIAKNLRGSQLEQKLHELFGED